MKSKIFLLAIVMFCTVATIAQPPNNAIFFGSVGDGFTRTANGSLSNAIFTGGAGDGFAYTSNGSASNNIFSGGIGDGWNRGSNNAVSNTIFIGGSGDGWSYAGNGAVSNSIFTGGIGDGWNNAGNAAPSNSIFMGGFGDGWNKMSNAAASNNIFRGGAGDGWTSIYQPVGPLPVNFLYFNVRKQGKNTALLSWKTAQELNSSHFDVERSTDAVNFTYIGKVNAKGTASTESNYSFVDHAPAKGFNYYRLKQVDNNGRFVYTVARVLNFDDLDAGLVKYYPNPTSSILNIELTGEMKNQEKWITISNAGGIVVAHMKIPGNSNNIIPLNLGKYPKGIYFIQLKTTCCNSTQRIVLQ